MATATTNCNWVANCQVIDTFSTCTVRTVAWDGWRKGSWHCSTKQMKGCS